MIEIIIMLIVMGWFAKEANTIGKNSIMWAFFAAISFYIPVIVFTSLFHIFLLSIAVGIGCLFCLRFLLIKLQKKDHLEIAKKWEIEKKKLIPVIELENPNEAIGKIAHERESNCYLGKITDFISNKNSYIIRIDFGKNKEMQMKELLIKME